MTRPIPMAALALMAMLLTGGCAGNRFGGDSYSERTFGDAVRAARASQTLNPAASQNPAAPAGLDGPAAKGTIDRYQKSFEAPPPAVNVYTIGVGGGAAGGSP